MSVALGGEPGRRPSKVDFSGERLTKKMQECHIQQKDLAEMLNVDRTSLNQRIKQCRMTMTELFAICSIIDSDVAYIRGEVDSDLGYKRRNATVSYDTPAEFHAAMKDLERKAQESPHVEVRTSVGENTHYDMRCTEYMSVDSVLDAIARIVGVVPLYDAIKRRQDVE